jgi:hypothetical protein
MSAGFSCWLRPLADVFGAFDIWSAGRREVLTRGRTIGGLCAVNDGFGLADGSHCELFVATVSQSYGHKFLHAYFYLEF